jgi:hypothetical protein
MLKRKSLFTMVIILSLAASIFFLPSAPEASEKKDEKEQREEIVRLKEKVDNLLRELFKINAALIAAKKNEEDLAREAKRALLGNMALSKLVSELLKGQTIPMLEGRVDPSKDEFHCGDWILFNTKKTQSDVCDESGFVCKEKIDKKFKRGIHINTNEYYAWIYDPEEQLFYRQQLKKSIPQQNIVLLEWEE